MSVVCYFRPGSRARILAGDTPKWISNNARAPYIESVCRSYPDWVDRHDLNLLRAWAKARSKFSGELYVMDHIIHWRVNGRKGNTWNPDQMELFPRR